MSEFNKNVANEMYGTKNSKASIKKFQRIFEAIPDLYFLVDSEGRHLDFKGNEDILFLTPEMFLGKKIKETLPRDVSEKYYGAIKKTLETKKPTIIEYSLPINNVIHHYEARNLYFSKDHVAIFVRDITEQRKADQILKAILDHTHMLVAYLDSQFNFVKVNRAYAKADDKDESYFPGKNHFDLYPNKENEEIFRKVVETGEPYFAYAKSFEYAEHPERGITYWDWSLIPIKNDTEVVEGLVFTLQNVTNKKIAEQKLKDSEEKYHNLFNNSPLGIFLFDENGNLLEGNTSASTSFSGFPSKLSYGKNFTEIISLFKNSNELLQIFKKRAEDRSKGKELKPVEIEIVRQDGEKRWLYWHSSAVHLKDKILIQAIVKDITESKQAEIKLRESEERLKDERDNLLNMLNSMEDGVYIINNNYEIEFVNPSLKNAFGSSENKKCYEYFQNISKPCPWCKTLQNITYGSIRWEWDSLVTNKFYEIIATPIKRADGTFSKLVILHDITQRKKAVEKIKRAREQADTYLNLAGVILIALNRDGIITLLNKKGFEILNYEEGELIGLNWFENCIPPRLKEEISGIFKQIINGDLESVEFFINPIITKEGQERIIAWHNTTLYDKNGNISGTLSSGEDITDRKKAEKELKRLSKLKSELLTRTSHELKTPVMHIKGYADLLLQNYKDNLGIDELQIISHIKKGVLRLETLIYDIMHKAELDSGEGELNMVRNNLSSLIELSVKELRSFAKLRGHSIIVDINDNLIINFDKEQIRHVINNLITNAIKYTPLNGIIGVKSIIEDNFITIAIQDNGIGFTEEQIKRLFTQFGKIERYGQGFDIITEGSGLGLHIAKKIIDLHGGRIWVESGGINKGSTFYFSLPKINE
ncbi:MAG: PAS domain S-box protein [Candidatus Hermodarchaeota archaeon]